LRARELALEGADLESPRHLAWFLYRQMGRKIEPQELTSHFALLDDNDVTAAIKYWSEAQDFTLSFLSKGLLDRRLFRLEWLSEPVSPERFEETRRMVTTTFGAKAVTEHFVFTGSESNRAYDDAEDQIKILFKNNDVRPITECSDVPLFTHLVTKHFICYPKQLAERL
jgi:hypothetical protein